MSKHVAVPLFLFACLVTPASASASARDRDHDTLPDRWEKRHHLSTNQRSAKRDPDQDHLTNRREYKLRTNPRRSDTDGDLLRDRAELKRYRTNPRRADTDRDGYSDGSEVHAGTNPRDPASFPSRADAEFSPGSAFEPLLPALPSDPPLPASPRPRRRLPPPARARRRPRRRPRTRATRSRRPTRAPVRK